MNTTSSQEIEREPYNPTAEVRAVEEAFQFCDTIAPTQQAMLRYVEDAGRGFALDLATVLPEGPAKQVAINSVMSAILWARQSITHRTVEIVAANLEGGQAGPTGLACPCAVGHPGEPGQPGEAVAQ